MTQSGQLHHKSTAGPVIARRGSEKPAWLSIVLVGNDALYHGFYSVVPRTMGAIKQGIDGEGPKMQHCTVRRCTPCHLGHIGMGSTVATAPQTKPNQGCGLLSGEEATRMLDWTAVLGMAVANWGDAAASGRHAKSELLFWGARLESGQTRRRILSW